LQFGERRFNGTRRGLPQPTDRGIAHDLSDLGMERQFVGERAQGLPGAQTMQQFLLAGCSHAAGHALTTGLVTKEGRDAEQNGLQINRIVKD
jgi:hypothetical protein